MCLTQKINDADDAAFLSQLAQTYPVGGSCGEFDINKRPPICARARLHRRALSNTSCNVKVRVDGARHRTNGNEVSLTTTTCSTSNTTPDDPAENATPIHLSRLHFVSVSAINQSKQSKAPPTQLVRLMPLVSALRHSSVDRWFADVSEERFLKSNNVRNEYRFYSTTFERNWTLFEYNYSNSFLHELDSSR